MATDAAALAKSIEPPEVVLPRLGWVPLLGPLLARVLPPKRYVGRVLSYPEFAPYQKEFIEAQRLYCARCGERVWYLEKEEGDEGAWTECKCPGDEGPFPETGVSEEEFTEVCADFLRAQGLPVRPVMALPGRVLHEVMRDLFTCQTEANTPMQERAPTSGNSSRRGARERPSAVRSAGRR